MVSGASHNDPDALYERAKKCRDGGGFLSFLTGTRRLEDAEELFVQAGNMYKLSKKWKESGMAFVEAAKIKITLTERNEAASRYVEAANAFKKVAPEEAVSAFDLAAQLFSENGRRSVAAKHKQTIAHICREDLGDLARAKAYYVEAAEIFAEEDAPSSANSCSLEAGKLAADLEQYLEAIRLLEGVATASTTNSLTKWSAKEYFLMGGICYLASGDVVGCRRALERFCEVDATFSTQRECVFLGKLVESLEGGDTDLFIEHCKEYDNLTKLDAWKTAHLLRAKKTVESESLT